jgi:hypothetical protein
LRTTYLALALTACATTPPHVAVRGDEVLSHLDELADSSQATVSAVRISEHGERGEDDETVFLYQTVTVNGATTTLEKALEGCGVFSSTHPCRVDARTRIVLREISQSMLAEEDAAAHSTAHPDDGPHTNAYNPALAHVAGALSLVTLAGTGICIAICEDDKQAKSVALGAGALVLAVIYAIASGARD